jgi:hypothetical protein
LTQKETERAEARRTGKRDAPASAQVILLQVAEPATLFLSLLSGMAYLPRIQQQFLDVTPEGGLLCQSLFTERLLHPVLTSFLLNTPKVRVI